MRAALITVIMFGQIVCQLVKQAVVMLNVYYEFVYVYVLWTEHEPRRQTKYKTTFNNHYIRRRRHHRHLPFHFNSLYDPLYGSPGNGFTDCGRITWKTIYTHTLSKTPHAFTPSLPSSRPTTPSKGYYHV